MVSITPEIVDAGYICIIPTINVYWNPNITSSSASEIATKVRDVVQTYANNDIKILTVCLDILSLSTELTLLMLKIVSNITTIRCERHFDAILNQESKYTLNFYNPIFTQGASSPTNLSSISFTIAKVEHKHFI